MKHIRSIINSVTGRPPRLLTMFTNYSNLRMLEFFQTYCLVNQPFFEPRTRESVPNALIVADSAELDFDLCVSFSGGEMERRLKDIANQRGIDCITYEMNFMKDLRTDIDYISFNKEAFMPCKGFSKKCYGSNKILIPKIQRHLISITPIKNRPLDIIGMGEFLIEKEYETNFSDWKYITNTIPSNIYGFNPKIGSYTPRNEDLPSVYNQAKIFINTKTNGLFPIELLEAMACGCIVVSYPYPGIEDFGVTVVKNKEECRQYVSDILADEERMSKLSGFNAEIAQEYKNNNDLQDLILNKWRDINEFGFQHYRISGL